MNFDKPDCFQLRCCCIEAGFNNVRSCIHFADKYKKTKGKICKVNDKDQDKGKGKGKDKDMDENKDHDIARIS
jgi:hypothetical protein